MIKKNVGIVGFGFLGRAFAHGFSLHANIKVYDKYDNTYDSLEDTVNSSRFIMIGVPTPMHDDGSQDLSNMDDAVKSVVGVANEKKIIVLRSTIIPGMTKNYADKYPDHDFLFHPEFLTERSAKLDFINAARIIIGHQKDNDKAAKEFEALYRSRFPHTPIYLTTWEAAEVVKYMCNSFFAVKISFLNELYDVANHIGIPYDELRNMFLADARIGNSHTDVPGHDGSRGYGGKCLVVGTKLVDENYDSINNENVEVGDKIFDGNSFTKITRVGSRIVDETVGVTSKGGFLQGSVDHPHLIYSDGNLVKREFKDLTLENWVFIPKRPNIFLDMRKVAGGWITKISKIEKLPGQRVISIETESGVYVANNILVHNCFPKDVQAFIGWAQSEELKLDMCEAADKVNTRIRTTKDWLDIKGATSKNNYK